MVSASRGTIYDATGSVLAQSATVYNVYCDPVMLKEHMDKKDKNIDNLKYYAHTLKGSSSAVSVHKLAEYSKKMEDAADNKDLTTFESIRVNFAVDFLTLKQLVKSWKSAL